jgi:hypothetical protein
MENLETRLNEVARIAVRPGTNYRQRQAKAPGGHDQCENDGGVRRESSD